MKKRLLIIFGMITCWMTSYAQAPDLIYYKFEDSSGVVNYATDPVGSLPATIGGTTRVDTGGFLGTGALADTGGPRVPNGGVNTGWNTSVDGSFTLSFWYRTDSAQEETAYLFGDSLAGYLCLGSVSNGKMSVLLLSTTSSFTGISWFGASPHVPHVFHFVHNSRPSKEAPYGTYSAYMDGVLFNAGIMTGPINTGNGLAIGRYPGGFYGDIPNLDGRIDEFKWYDRALTATEVANTYNIDVSHLGDCPSFSSFTMDSISGDGARIHWKPGTGNTSYFLEYDTADFTPGTGTMLTGNYPADTPMVALTGLNPETTYDIYFVEVCGGGDSVYTPAPYSFETTIPCLMPTGLEISNVTTDSADIHWDFMGSLQESYLIYGPVGFDPAISGEIDTAFSTSHTLSNLASGTWYDIYLVVNCGTGNGLSDTIYGTFTTDCHPFAAPFFEDFEDSTVWTPIDPRHPVNNYSDDTLDPCWRRTPSWVEEDMGNITLGTGRWGVRTWRASTTSGPDSGAKGSENYLFTIGGGDAGEEAIIYSPYIDVSALVKPYLSFYYHRYGASQPDFFVDVNGGHGWTTVITMKGPQQLQQSDPYDSTGINISSFGDTVRIRFRAMSVGRQNSYMGLDNFEIKEAPPATCEEVTEIVHTGTSQDTSVTIDVPSEGHYFNFEWGPSGFIQGTGCIGQGTVPYTLDSCIGLNTIQEVYIQNNCQDSGLGVAPYTGPFEFCTPFTAPYSNDFDDETLEDKPQCWKEYSAAALGASTQGIDIYLYPGEAFSDKNVLRIYDETPSEGDTFMALTPRFIDMPEGNKQVRFVAYAPGSRIATIDGLPRELVVGTMSSYTEGSDFHPIDTISVSRTSWEEYTVQLDPSTTAYNGTDQIVALRYLAPVPPPNPSGGGGRLDYCLIDNFHYEEIPACLPPDMTTLKTVFVMDNRAEVNWVPRGSGDITLEWGISGFMPGTGEAEGTATTADTSMLITGLIPKTSYELYIRTDCGGSQSYWVGPLKFKTACSISAPYFEDFNGPQWYAPSRAFNAYNCGDSIDDCWSRRTTCERYGTTWNYTWGVQDQDGGVVAQDHGGGGNYIFPVRGGINDTAYIYSPVIDVSTLNNPYLSFYYHRFEGVPDFWVSINNGDGQGWRRIIFLTGLQQNSFTAPFRKAGIDISAYGDTVQIRFAAAIAGEMAVDDVRIDEAPPCSMPENLSAKNVVDTNTGQWSTLLQWEDFQQLATEYEIRFGLEGFADSGAYDNGYADTITTKSYAIDTLSPNTCYEFIVRSICGGDTGAFEGPFVFCTPCEPEVAPYLYPFKKSSSARNPMYQNQTFEGGTDCWRRDFTEVSGSAYIWRSSSDRLVVAGSGPDEGVYDGEYAYVASRDGADGDVAVLYSPIVDIRQLTTPELSFYYHMYGPTIDTLRLDLYDGVQWYNNVAMLGGPQQNYSYSPWRNMIVELDSFNNTGFVQARFRIKKVGFQGEVSIDEFRIGDSLTCQYPFNFRSEDSLTTEATLRWSGDVADDYVVEYGPSGYPFGQGTEINTSADSVAIPINDNRMYHGYIRSICGPGDTSDAVGPIQFNSKVFPCDDLEAYTPGPLDDQSTLFRPWNPIIEDIFDVIGDYTIRGDEEISDQQSLSGTQSLHLYEGAAGGSGVLTNMERIESGIHKVGFNILIADTGGATYEIFTNDNAYASAVFFLDGMRRMCDIYRGGLIHSFPFTGNWDRIEHIMDLDNDTTWMLVNGININFGWKYSSGSTPGISGLHFLTTPSNLNISGAASDFYIDDFCVEEYECPAPSALAMDQSTCTQAIIEWMSGVDSSTTILEYDTTGFSRGGGTAFTIKANSETLTGLTPGGSYDVYVGEVCGLDTVYAGPLTITMPTEAIADFTIDEGDPTATDLTVDFDGSTSTGADTYHWDFGEGSTDSVRAPSHTYTANGNYIVQLIVESDCGSDTITKTVIIFGISIEENILSQSLEVFPNPTQDRIQLHFETQGSEDAVIRLSDLSGKMVMERRVSDINGRYEGELDLSHLAKGSYMLRIESRDLYVVKRVVRN